MEAKYGAAYIAKRKENMRRKLGFDTSFANNITT